MEEYIHYYNENRSALVLADCFDFLKKINENSVDMIFADPPYFLSNGGVTNSGGKFVSVNKGEWDKIGSLEEKHTFNREWIKLSKRVLKPNGTIWISGSFHNIYSVGMALEQENFKILNNITWSKNNPAPNLSCRYFVHSTETIIWAKKNIKSNHYFAYEEMKKMNKNKQMKDIWTGPKTPYREKIHGKHPTQKPEYLLEKIILSSTKKDDLILDPFLGSGTTAVVSKRLERRFIGIDKESEYLDIALKRINSLD
ncbi:site-specific DNA-methyltransferase [Vagococcus fluvialis]|uniref:DNA-methyltransferase n=1 Tax=Vagococcus fluvialis TaxID=2738 RepID=UPI0014332757|nr:site-specific DNA-methyltransferase [Vagococcus fluvialis]NKC59419.1 site-specific DNA-methyltransferase [Vagococcus fluvialis]NKD50185.1 site-specific DNA-methyltransferase [Vagococcus fluvialis]